MYKYIAMDTEYCSMGRWISVITGNRLHMKLYEEADLCELAGIDYDTFKAFAEKIADMRIEEIKKDPEMKQMHQAFTHAIRKALDQGPCIIHEKAATDLLKDRDDVLKVMLYCSSLEHKIPRAIADGTYNTEGLSKDEIKALIRREDLKRTHYHDAVSTAKWGEKSTYDMLLDSDVLTREKCAEILIEACSPVRINHEEAAKIISSQIHWSKDVDVSDLG